MMLKRLINRNFRKPKGLIGRYIIRFLRKNQIEYEELDPLLKLNENDVVLEIGYGLGQGIYDYAKKYPCTFHGVDFSKLMYRKACRLNREHISRGRVVLQCADFDHCKYENNTFHCIYFLNVIYFWDEIRSRLAKIFSILKPEGKVIIFMADAERFSDSKPSPNETVFYLRSIHEVVNTMMETGFTAIEAIEHTREKKCYYLVGYRP